MPEPLLQLGRLVVPLDRPLVGGQLALPGAQVSLLGPVGGTTGRGARGAASIRGAVVGRGARSVDLTSRASRVDANRLYQQLGFQLRDSNVYRYRP
jgi:hypothetical protein